MNVELILFNFIIPALFLPFLILIFNHPNVVIRWVSRFALVLMVFCLVAGVPIYMLVQLKYWSLLLILIPIMFRVFSLVLDRIGFFSSKNLQVVENLMYASVGALSIIFIGASSNTLENVAFLVLVIFLLNATDFKIVDKYPIIGMIFGPIIAVIPSYANFNIYYTAIFVWASLTLLLELFVKLFKIEKTKRLQKIVLILFLNISIITANSGGVPLNWTDICLRFLSLFSIACLIFGSSYLVNHVTRNNKLVFFYHYVPVVVSISLLLLIFFLMGKYKGVNLFFEPIITIVILFAATISLSRLMAPLDKLSNKSFPFKLDSIIEMMEMVFGQKLGQALFNSLFGAYYDRVKWYSSIIFFIIILIFGINIIGFSIPSFNLLSVEDGRVLYSFILAFSMLSSLGLLSEIARIGNGVSLQSGLSSEDALHSSTIICFEYFSIFLPLLLYYFDFFKSINIGLKIVAIMYLVLVFINLNIMLYFDLKNERYNQFRRTRIGLGAFLQGFSITIAPIIFFAAYKDDRGLFFINDYNAIVFGISFLLMFCAKLIGYDIEFGSKKIYRRSLWIVILVVLSIKGIYTFLPFMAYLIFRDEHRAIYYSVLFFLSFISIFGRELAIILLPWSNHTRTSITKDWKDMLQSIKTEKRAENKSNLVKASVHRRKNRF